MSVENSKTIDSISVSSNDVVVLTISDHLEWDDEYEHLSILQDKINVYLEVLESREIFEIYPYCENREFQINIMFKFSPNEVGIIFLEKVKEIVEQAGFQFDYNSINN